MKKGLKKEIEHELIEAINKTLTGHNAHVISKTKKAVKTAGKSIARKFVKSLKALAEKSKEAVENKSNGTSVKVNKAVASKKLKNKAVVAVRASNGRFKSVKNKINLPGTSKKKVAHPSRLTVSK